MEWNRHANFLVMTTSPLMITLNDTRTMPQLGFGMWQMSDAEEEAATLEAFRVGYRSIDSAMIYENEKGLGEAIHKSKIARKELFITTKLWNDDQGYDSTLAAFEESMNQLDLDVLDLYLIHWPSPHRSKYVESWKALIELQKLGKVKSIGVSNFTIENLKRIIDDTGVVPAVNQIELHPRFQQKELRAFHQTHQIATESWSPLGQGKLLSDPTLQTIAKKYGKSTAQIIIRWHLDNGLIVIPKSVTPSRIRENFEVFNFKLNGDDLAQIEKLDANAGRIGPDPATAAF
jgi:2,5-diketo-D-gluconate reductase A